MGLLSILDVLWTNVVIGVIAGLVVAFGGKAKDRVQDNLLDVYTSPSVAIDDTLSENDRTRTDQERFVVIPLGS